MLSLYFTKLFWQVFWQLSRPVILYIYKRCRKRVTSLNSCRLDSCVNYEQEQLGLKEKLKAFSQKTILGKFKYTFQNFGAEFQAPGIGSGWIPFMKKDFHN